VLAFSKNDVGTHPPLPILTLFGYFHIVT